MPQKGRIEPNQEVWYSSRDVKDGSEALLGLEHLTLKGMLRMEIW